MATEGLHKPTLGTAVILVIVLLIAYHFLFHKKS